MGRETGNTKEYEQVWSISILLQRVVQIVYNQAYKLS